MSIAGRAPGRTRDAELAAKADLADVRARWEGVKRDIVSVLSDLPPGRLDEDALGPVSSRSVNATIVHAIAHASEHAGQAELTRDLLCERR